jgi:LysM repeat protein
MKDDPELKINDAWPDDNPYPSRRRSIESGSSKVLRILVIIILVLVFIGGILYFLGRQPTGSETNLLQSKVTALEQRMTGLEKQFAELSGKIGTLGPDPALLQRLDTLTQKVEALEKQKPLIVESKPKPSLSTKLPASTEKQYHTVRKGDTLYRISKKYGISVEELKKLNNLSAGQPIQIGRRLLVSPGH